MNLNQILSLDLEITKDNKKLRHLGAVLGDETLNLSVDKKNNYRAVFKQLDDMAAKARFVLGHNIIAHDLPWLQTQKIHTVLKHLSALPVIDTLFLSPLAFPKNPYHRLVKDYKIISDSYNNPVQDARLALKVFAEQLEAFKQCFKTSPHLLELYQYLFSHHQSHGVDTSGLADVMQYVIDDAGQKKKKNKKGVRKKNIEILIAKCLVDQVCPNQLRKLIKKFRLHQVSSIALSYAVAWLQVAGGNSILPPWVWHQFPAIKQLIRQLREEHCGDKKCTYCKENFNAQLHLQRFFELPDFRLLPDGTPLQKEIIEAAVQGKPLLGILPTGGGKSLCYQLPALIRNKQNASLTIVISPLQALMKDQVDNLKDKVGIEGVAAVYGMITMPERSAILDAVRMGDISILYLSPEQLRNRIVKQAIVNRQIGAWVFDEAHCLSKWGHDFRPDYLYCAKVIAKIAHQQEESPPPVFCYTATAKKDVIEDICEHFSNALNFKLERFEGGVERDNLLYQVVSTPVHHKLSRVLALLTQYFNNDQPGSCVIYCATRKGVEQLYDDLQSAQDLSVRYFHAGLENTVKREVLEGFIAGEYRIICATNAFGMGIDKDDVRLVIHYDIPGSLENYLQEAGRAGRDLQQASCILLFDHDDIEQQFKLSKQSEIRLKDISEILKEIRYRSKSTDGRVITTSKELLRSDYVNSEITVEDKMADTKVKTAISWLEREGFLSREDNVNSVFQGKPLFANLEDADKKLEQLQLSTTLRQQWRLILEALINAQIDEGINADDILDKVLIQVKDIQQKQIITPQRIMEILAQMATCGLVSKGFSMTAWLRPKGKDNARLMFLAISEIENTLLQILPESEPDADLEHIHQMDLRAVNAILIREHELKSSTRIVRQLLKTWSEDGKLSGEQGSINFKVYARELFSVQLNRTWRALRSIARQRQLITTKVLNYLYLRLSSSEAVLQKKVMIDFALEDVITALQQDESLKIQLADKSKIEQQAYLLKGIERALLFLDTHKSIELQNGMAVFKQAMELQVPENMKNRYTRNHYRQLDDHYHQKVVQVHVMYEYARLGLDQIKTAIHLVKDYFELLNEPFVSYYFKNRKSILKRATSTESWHKIVVALHNQSQQEIVHAAVYDNRQNNQLVLAGPGSGKSKVIIHRVAYLLRVEQIPSKRILVLTFNHNAAVSLQKRLIELLGDDARYIRVHTFHGLALRLSGQTFDAQTFSAQSLRQQKQKEDGGFDVLIEDAINLLTGKTHELGLDNSHQRSALLDGLEHILVDEYQDIDQLQYEMIAALAGQCLEEDEKINLMVVGDDDQSIYQFRQANVKFIQQFKEDYQAKSHYLTQNYRSTRNIIAAANSLIVHNKDRMKNDYPIIINDARQMDIPGGRWQNLDLIHQGKVKIVHCDGAAQQANEVLCQILKIKEIDPHSAYSDIVVLARHGIEKNELSQLRSVLYQAHIPYCYSAAKEDSFPLHAVKEIIKFKDFLKTADITLITTDEMLAWLPQEKNNWHHLIHQIILDWQALLGDAPLLKTLFINKLNDYLLEQNRQTRYGSGVLLSTIHGVKGEEFKYVIVLDGAWNYKTNDSLQHEEERRLYYVAMTRAEEQLILMYYAAQPQDNPHISLIDKSVCSEYISQADTILSQSAIFMTTGLSHLFLSYAARMTDNNPAIRLLNELEAGDQVQLVSDAQGKINIKSGTQVIAQLSQLGQKKLNEGITQEYQAKIIAMICRKTDPESPYDKNNQQEQWWVPVVEVIVDG